MRSKTGSRRGPGGRTGRIQFTHTYEDIISVENLLAAWREFVRGKRKKRDVQEFQHVLMDNILALHRDLKDGTYRHGGYKHFRISDPKPRDIHKASVRDRLRRHALYRTLYRTLYLFFDRTFISDSYSCRRGKGTHKAMNRFRQFASKVSRNDTRTCWVLKCDIRKFFASIDPHVLLSLMRRYIPDERIVALIAEVVGSFKTHKSDLWVSKGLPLGNLTSQLLVNIYMNEFDHFVKHALKAKYYVRYADNNCVILSQDKKYLEEIVRYIALFLSDHLKLSLHPQKVSIQTLASGVDFLGWVHFPDHRVLRSATKRRMLRNLSADASDARVESYRGMLSHGNARKLVKDIDDAIQFK